jgi:hypothetical protein
MLLNELYFDYIHNWTQLSLVKKKKMEAELNEELKQKKITNVLCRY